MKCSMGRMEDGGRVDVQIYELASFIFHGCGSGEEGWA